MNRSKRIEPPLKPTLKLVGDGKAKSGDVLSPYGPLRVGLTTSPETNKVAQLSELVSSLEKKAETLESRYFTLLDTFLSVTNLLVQRGAFTENTDGTDVLE